jgi:hypothetical protein
LSVSALLVYINRDAIKQRAIQEVNQRLDEPVSIASVDISFAKLPRAAVIMKEIFCAGANSQKGDTLLFAKRAYLEFNLWELWKEPLVIEAVSLEEGVLDVKMRRSGEHNYKIWKSNDEPAEENATWRMPGLKLSEMRLNYEDELQDLRVSTWQSYLNLNGEWLADRYSFEVEHEGVVRQLTLDKEQYLYDEPVKNSFKLKGIKNEIQIVDANARFSYLTTIYSLSYTDDEWLFKASTTQPISINNLLATAEKQTWITEKTGAQDGYASINFEYKSAKASTEYQLSGSFEDVQYISKNIILPKVSGNYKYVKSDIKEKVEIRDAKIEFPSGDLELGFLVEDLDQPKVKVSIVGELDFEDWASVMAMQEFKDMRGKVYSNMTFSNQFVNFENIVPANFANARLNGALAFKEVGFKPKAGGKKLSKLKGDIVFKDQSVNISGLYGILGSSDLFVEGSIENVISGWYFDDQKIAVKGRLVAQKVDLEDFLVQGTDQSASEEDEGLGFLNSISCNLSLDVMQFRFRTFQSNDIKGILQMDKGTILGKNVSLKTCDGDLTGNFVIYTDQLPYRANSAFKAQNVSIPKLFSAFDNFGQSTLTHKNLEGIGDASVQVKGVLDGQLRVNLSSVKANASLKIREGALNDFEPMLALSDYVDVAELKQVRFRDLENEISVDGGFISIPKMDINSNALDLQITGTHSFENVVDYSLRLELGEVLFNKRRAKSKPGEFDDFIQEEPDADNLPIYLRMQGPMEAIEINLDKTALSKAVRDDLKGQKTDLQKIFAPDSVKAKPNKTGIQFSWPEEDDG